MIFVLIVSLSDLAFFVQKKKITFGIRLELSCFVDVEWWNNEWWRGVNILQTDSRSKLEALESGSWHEGWEGQIFKQPKRRNVGLPNELKWNNSVI